MAGFLPQIYSILRNIRCMMPYFFRPLRELKKWYGFYAFRIKSSPFFVTYPTRPMKRIHLVLFALAFFFVVSAQAQTVVTQPLVK